MRKIIALLFFLGALTSFAQLLKTSLSITVRDETGNIVTGADIAMYETADDYTREKNAVFTAVTDEREGELSIRIFFAAQQFHPEQFGIEPDGSV